MGHQHLGRLPGSRKWRQVIALIEARLGLFTAVQSGNLSILQKRCLAKILSARLSFPQSARWSGILYTFGLLPGDMRGLPFDRKVETLVLDRSDVALMVRPPHAHLPGGNCRSGSLLSTRLSACSIG
jgi:hypothetical protein